MQSSTIEHTTATDYSDLVTYNDDWSNTVGVNPGWADGTINALDS